MRRWHAELLADGVTPVTAAKAYRLLKSIMATAVDDGLIRRNPCRIKGGGHREVTRAARADRGPGLRPGRRGRHSLPSAGPAGLLLRTALGRAGRAAPQRHRHRHGTVRVVRQLTEAPGQPLHFGPPKSDAGRRVVAIPPVILPDVTAHLADHTASGALMRSSSPARAASSLRHGNFRRGTWLPAIGRHWSDRHPLPRPAPCREPAHRQRRGEPAGADGTHGPLDQPGRAGLPALDQRPATRAGQGGRHSRPLRARPVWIPWHVCGTAGQ